MKIYIDRLKEGQKEEIDETLPPDFLGVAECTSPLIIKGQAYLAEQELVLQLDVNTKAHLPCVICNQAVEVPLVIKKMYMAIPTSEIKGAVFDAKAMVREMTLLEMPTFVECNQGACSTREEISSYLKKGQDGPAPNPFKQLNIP